MKTMKMCCRALVWLALMMAAIAGCAAAPPLEPAPQPEANSPEDALRTMEEERDRRTALARAYARELEAVLSPLDRVQNDAAFGLTRTAERDVSTKLRKDLDDGRFESVCAVITIDGWWKQARWYPRVLERTFLYFVDVHPESLASARVCETLEHLMYRGADRDTRIWAGQLMIGVDRDAASFGLYLLYGEVGPGERWTRLGPREVDSVAKYLRLVGEGHYPDELTNREIVEKLYDKQGNPKVRNARSEVTYLAGKLFNNTLRAHAEAGREGVLKRLHDGEVRHRLLIACLRSAEEMLLVGCDGELPRPPGGFFGGGEDD